MENKTRLELEAIERGARRFNEERQTGHTTRTIDATIAYASVKGRRVAYMVRHSANKDEVMRRIGSRLNDLGIMFDTIRTRGDIALLHSNSVIMVRSPDDVKQDRLRGLRVDEIKWD